MAINIVQGTLPYDGELVDPSVFIETWINNTKVYNLPNEAFKGGTFQFVISQTDAPPLYTRFMGMLWFARGEGRLKIWDYPDPSALTFTDANWINISDRREVWLYACEGPIKAGQVCRFMNTTDTLQTGILTASGAPTRFDAFPRMLWCVQATETAATNAMIDQTFIAIDSATSGSVFRAVDFGFCDILLASGETGSAGAVSIDEQKAGIGWRIEETCGSKCRYAPIAETLDSSATNPGEPWRRSCFKHLLPLVGLSNTA